MVPLPACQSASWLTAFPCLPRCGGMAAAAYLLLLPPGVSNCIAVLCWSLRSGVAGFSPRVCYPCCRWPGDFRAVRLVHLFAARSSCRRVLCPHTTLLCVWHACPVVAVTVPSPPGVGSELGLQCSLCSECLSVLAPLPSVCVACTTCVLTVLCVCACVC